MRASCDDVLAHVVDADVHQLHGIQRRAAVLRRAGCMGGLTVEVERDVVDRQAARRRDGILRGRVPGDGGVEIVEDAVTRHEDLAGASLLGRTAVVADRAGPPVLLQPRLERHRRRPGRPCPACYGHSRGRGRP